jgi:hypothetical protein
MPIPHLATGSRRYRSPRQQTGMPTIIMRRPQSSGVPDDTRLRCLREGGGRDPDPWLLRIHGLRRACRIPAAGDEAGREERVGDLLLLPVFGAVRRVTTGKMLTAASPLPCCHTQGERPDALTSRVRGASTTIIISIRAVVVENLERTVVFRQLDRRAVCRGGPHKVPGIRGIRACSEASLRSWCACLKPFWSSI